MHRPQRALLITSLVLLLSLTVASVALAVTPINTSRFSNVAIKGYDPVAYFEQSRAEEGDKGITHEWSGATWRFSTARHRDLFAADPEKYAPQYGGYCAYAVSKGSTANGDPEVWKIYEGRLYLNYSKSIQKKWEVDIPGNVAKADAKWPMILAE